jgi:hypothetical protein
MELEFSLMQTSNRMPVLSHQQVCRFAGGVKAQRVLVPGPDGYERLSKFNIEASELPVIARLGAGALWK